MARIREVAPGGARSGFFSAERRAPDAVARVKPVTPAGPQRRLADGGNVFGLLAGVTEAANAFIEPAAEQEMRDLGAAAVYRDEDGVLRVAEKSPLGGRMAAIYNTTALTAYVAQQRVDTAKAMSEFRLLHEGSPQNFQIAADAYREQVVSGAPQSLQPEIDASIQSAALQTFNGLVVQKTRDLKDRANTSTSELMTLLGQDAIEAFEAGNDEAFQNAISEWESVGALRIAQGFDVQESVEIARRRLMDTAEGRRLGVIKTRFTDAIGTIRNGRIADGEAELLADAEGTEFYEPLATAIAARDLYPDFARSSPDEQQALIDQIKAEGVTPETERALGELESIRANGIKAIAEDPIAHAVDRNVIPAPTVVDLFDPRTVRNRAVEAATAQNLGFNPQARLFSNAEVNDFRDQIDGATPGEQVAMIRSLMGGLGPNLVGRAIEEIGAKGPFTHSAYLLTGGMSENTVSLILAGAQMEKPTRPTSETRRAAEGEVFSALQSAVPAQAYAALIGPVREAADAYYAARVLDADEGDEEDVYKEALQVALGGEGGRGGVQDVLSAPTLLPSSLTGAAVEQRVEQVWALLSDEYVFPTDGRIRDQSDVDRIVASGAKNRAANKSEFQRIFSGASGAGYPMMGNDPAAFSDLNDIALVAVANDIYELHVMRDGGSMPMTDSATGGVFTFSLSELMGR